MAELTTGTVTAPGLEGSPPSLRVTWLGWDSPFRGTGLSIGDRITAVNGDPIGKGDDVSQSIGQYAESQGWEKAGLSTGAPITVRVRRRDRPMGWRDMEVKAGLIEIPHYRNAENRIVLGAGGPDTSAYDGFPVPWGSWCEETLVKALSRALDVDAQSATYVTRFEHDELRKHQDRVAHAEDHYPGPFATALASDFAAALGASAGRPVALAPGALDFRRRGEELAGEIREKAEVRWRAFLASVAASTIAPFPAVHPVRAEGVAQGHPGAHEHLRGGVDPALRQAARPAGRALLQDHQQAQRLLGQGPRRPEP